MGGIIWLASYPKSGNTWTRTFLLNLFQNPDKPIDINLLKSSTVGDANVSSYERAAGKPITEISGRELAKLTPKVHELMARSRSDSVFVKTHTAFGNVYGTPLITMKYTAGAVYMVRNPLDVVISLADHFGLDLDGGIRLLNNPKGKTGSGAKVQSGKADLIEQLLGSWSSHVTSWLPFSQRHFHLMRYEDMLDKPEETFGGLARFLGLNPPEERLARAIEFSSFKNVQKQEEEKGFNEQSKKNDRFFRVGKSGQWKDVLTDKQVDKIVKYHYDTMKQFGYLPK
ncbi:MAG: sulfotransferase domain-containing protein [Sneathiella sp.]|uniref:sulfotransferase domain-containing protein n=1 Tax=Sneathiella sp. TaxID=1964365 RepID=UPI003003062C